MVSVGTMVKKLEGLLGTRDINSWEQSFIESIVRMSKSGTDTTVLSANQITVVDDMHRKHFGG